MDMINFIRKTKNIDAKNFSDLKLAQIQRFKQFNKMLIKKEKSGFD